MNAAAVNRGSSLINNLKKKIETMGVRIIAFTVGVQREIIKRMLQLAVKN